MAVEIVPSLGATSTTAHQGQTQLVETLKIPLGLEIKCCTCPPFYLCGHFLYKYHGVVKLYNKVFFFLFCYKLPTLRLCRCVTLAETHVFAYCSIDDTFYRHCFGRYTQYTYYVVDT
jgi:hypothetical protein